MTSPAFFQKVVEILGACLEPLLELFPRQRLASARLSESSASRQSVILALQAPARRSWALLQARTGRPSRPQCVRVRFINRDAEAVSVEIPLNRNGTLREIVQVSVHHHALELEFLEPDSHLHFQEIALFEITEWERKLRLLDRVWRFLPAELLRIPWHQRVSKLDLLYVTVRQKRIQRLNADPYARFLDEVEPHRIASAIRDLSGLLTAPAPISPKPFFFVLLDADTPDDAPARASLLAQTYPHWAPLDSLGTQTPAPKNAWILPLRSNEVLRPEALAILALESSLHPSAQVLYSDHDFLDSSGRRHFPVFKPDWNRDLFFSHNYLASPCAFSLSACLRHSIAPSRLAHSEERYGLILSLSEATPEAIRHLSLVLLHRACAAESSLTGGDAAPRAVLEARLAPLGATVHPGLLQNTLRVRWPLPEAPPLVSILIATRNQDTVLRACIESILHRTHYPSWEILVIDNQSSDPDTLAYLRELDSHPNIRVLPYHRPFNYSAIQNFGATHARGSVLAFLNNDVEVITPLWLEELVRHALRPEIGAVGARLLYSDGRIQHAGVALGIGGVAGHLHRYFPAESPGYCGRIQLTQQLSAVTAACLVVRKSAFESVGGFDEKYLKIALNDVDLCLKLVSRGWHCVYEPAVTLYHHESLSRGPDDTPKKRRIFLRERRVMLSRWSATISKDPHYNPNLTLETEDCAVRHSLKTPAF